MLGVVVLDRAKDKILDIAQEIVRGHEFSVNINRAGKLGPYRVIGYIDATELLVRKG